jgi:hypothetical protein
MDAVVVVVVVVVVVLVVVAAQSFVDSVCCHCPAALVIVFVVVEPLCLTGIVFGFELCIVVIVSPGLIVPSRWQVALWALVISNRLRATIWAHFFHLRRNDIIVIIVTGGGGRICIRR